MPFRSPCGKLSPTLSPTYGNRQVLMIGLRLRSATRILLLLSIAAFGSVACDEPRGATPADVLAGGGEYGGGPPEGVGAPVQLASAHSSLCTRFERRFRASVSGVPRARHPRGQQFDRPKGLKENSALRNQ